VNPFDSDHGATVKIGISSTPVKRPDLSKISELNQINFFFRYP
jgi:hypothetical protein